MSDTIPASAEAAYERFCDSVAQFHEALRTIETVEGEMNRHLAAMQQKGAPTGRIMTAATMLGAVRQVLRAGPSGMPMQVAQAADAKQVRAA